MLFVIIIPNMAAVQEVKLFNKWNLEEVEISDIALNVCIILLS